MYLNIIFSLFAISAVIDVLRSSKIKGFRYINLYWGSVFILILLSSLRWERGTDWDTYYLFYNGFNAITIDSYMEPGFSLFTSVNKAVFPFYTFQLFAMAVIAIGCTASTILKYSVFPFVSLLVWFSMSLANIFPVRQTIAVALLIYASRYIINRQKYRFIAMLCIAATFHYSALVFGLAYYLFHQQYSRRFLVITLLTAIVVSFVAESLVSNVLYTVGGQFFQNKLEYYMETNADNDFGSAYSAQEVLIRGIINRSLLFIIPLLFLEKKRCVDSVFNGFFNLYYFAFMLFVLVVPISPVLGRFTSYYDYSQFFIIPYFFVIPFTRKSLYIICFLVCTYCLLRFNGVVQNYRDEYIPYKSIFSI